MDLTELAKLKFFRIVRYECDSVCCFDYTNCPRPHNCMALILEGGGTFYCKGEVVKASAGDILFIPITTRYASEWYGTPKTAYITIFYSFESPSLFFKQRSYCMQKVTPSDSRLARERFEDALNGYLGGEEDGMFTALSVFYRIAAEVYPRLKLDERKPVDERIERAVTYLDAQCEKKTTVSELAHISNMSVPYFYSRFHEVVGMSPIEYKNQARINKAILLLMGGKASIEQISETLGFYSSGYFRHVFKSVTGKSPREYRKTFAQL